MERKVEKKLLSDRFVASLKPRAERFSVLDTDVRGFAVRVNRNGSKTWLLIKKFPGYRNPTARALGSTDALTLAEARELARSWTKKIARGIDPAKDPAEQSAQTFGSLAEEYFTRHLSGLRSGKDLERQIRKELISRWQSKPITEISRQDVISLVNEIAGRGAKRQASKVLGNVHHFFGWCLQRGLVEHSPCEGLKPTQMFGKNNVRTRVLRDPEIRAFWHSCEIFADPHKELFRFLLLTGQRFGEVAGASWTEFSGTAWTIPPERTKSNVTHRVPLSREAVALLDSLPRMNEGPFVFSMTAGRTPIRKIERAKQKLVAEMRKTLPEMADFVPHDLRRTMRSRLSELRVPENIAELAIGHGKKGLVKVYDQHRFDSEIAEAMQAWADRLTAIVNQPSLPRTERVSEQRSTAESPQLAVGA